LNVTEPSRLEFARAVSDFRDARQRAALQRVLSRLTGQRTHLLSFDEVRETLRGTSTLPRGLQEIPLDAIVGSVGRYSDFTRSFLPLVDSQAERWARVKAMAEGQTGLPPIEVYKIGDAYFVRDGHHRVSVARDIGARSIEANVTEVEVKIPLSPDDSPRELILKAEYASFLERTRLDVIRPDADLRLTEAGKYPLLEEHIAVHRYFMGVDQHRDVPYEEAVAHWFDTVYRPIVDVIHDQGLLRDFPGRTESDLYLWVIQHRAELESSLGWTVDPDEAAAHLAAERSPRAGKVAERLGEKLLSSVIPDELNAGPPPGDWRKKREKRSTADRLFRELLVPLRHDTLGWEALNQAIEVARHESGKIRGLHLVAHPDEADSHQIRSLQADFKRRCHDAGVEGDLAIDVGPAARKICERAAWTDLIVVSLAHPPAPQGVARLASGFRGLIRRCPGPVLAVPRTAGPIDTVLLAYDGSPKAREALYVATYMGGVWDADLRIVAVDDKGQDTGGALDDAQSYLASYGVEATSEMVEGDAADRILDVAERHGSNLIVMGGYGANPMVEVVLGSVVDEVLRRSAVPVLLCR
jgi:nucleotide-binding universal stress UspA family protein